MTDRRVFVAYMDLIHEITQKALPQEQVWRLCDEGITLWVKYCKAIGANPNTAYGGIRRWSQL